MEHASSKNDCVQFVRNGPHLPESLLQAHEDGRVVFFCGAGISMPKLLAEPKPSARSKPLDFASLVESLYTEFGVTPNPRQKRAIETRQYDIAVGLLEPEIVGGREEVRRTLASILADQTKPNKDTAHGYLLELSKSRDDGGTRLVTTNFDRLFEDTIEANELEIKRFYAPLLPIPKKQWDGLVYLHGLLPKDSTKGNLHHLVISSGDFGLAYLTERWASRFVSELFRNYIVCFVGYSLNDPVLRYMTDAIAADRQRGESALEIFAFGGYSEGKAEEECKEWKDKSVTPILYLEDKEHTHLRKTLQDWSKVYQGGVKVKERIVDEYADRCPLKSTKEDNFVSRMIWALGDPSCLPAKHFAELNPMPSLNWLAPMSKEHSRQAGLDPYVLSAKEGFGGRGISNLPYEPPPSKWDQVMWQLAPWLTHHLNNPALLLGVAEHGYLLRRILANPIESQLNKLNRLKPKGNTTKLKSIRPTAPDAMPSSPMRTLWRLLLAGRVSSASRIRCSAFRLWKTRFRRYGLTTALRLELRECLTPRVSLHKLHNGSAIVDDEREQEITHDELTKCEVVLFADNILSDMKELADDECWDKALPELLTEFSSLLRDALDLMRELGSASDRNDPSCDLCPSISYHAQNTDPNDWTALISLVRDAWLFTAKQSPERARRAAEDWSQEPYPLFRRLAFFAAAQGKTIPRRQGLNWLLADEHWWLWSPETRRETVRLLVALAPRLTKDEMAELEKAILSGPPPTTPKNQIDREHQANIIDWDIWLRLAKIDQARATLCKGDWLSKDGRKKFAELSDKHLDWKLAEDESDEFPVWISVSGMEFVPTPRPLQELIKWLKKYPTSYWRTNGRLTNDDWQERCRNNFPTAACALCALAKMGNWPAGRWKTALQTWSEEKLTQCSWRYMAPVLASATNEQLQLIAPELSQWLSAIAKIFVDQEEVFLALCNRVLALEHKDENDSGNDFLACAINHPVGRATEALLNWCYRGAPKDGQGLPDELKSALTMLCDKSVCKFRHGRVVLAFNLMSLFSVDRGWVTKHLLPLFDWRTSEIEACAVWQGFLWNSSPSRPLTEALKPAFLETASHYEMLVNHGRQRALFGEKYASLLTFAALNWGDAFENKGLATATRALPKTELSSVAQELIRVIEEAGEQRANYWTNRVAPYLRKIWPKTRDKIYPGVRTDLGHICVVAQEAFPKAFDLLQYWLQPTTDPSNCCDYGYLARQLNETTICSQFPERALDFLDLVIPKQPYWVPEELRTCLKDIQTYKPELERGTKYQRLMECVLRQEVDLISTFPHGFTSA